MVLCEIRGVRLSMEQKQLKIGNDQPIIKIDLRSARKGKINQD